MGIETWDIITYPTGMMECSFVRRTAAFVLVPLRYVHLARQVVKAETPQPAGVTRYFETMWLAVSHARSL